VFKFKLLFTVFLFIACFCNIYTQEIFTPTQISDNQIIIDGSISENEWANAEIIYLDNEIEPGNNNIPEKETKVYVLYSKKNLYVGFYAYDDSSNIRASIRQRDDFKLFNDDWVNIKLDTYADSRNNYNLIANPLGSQTDVLQVNAISDEKKYDINFNVEFETSGKILSNGYNVEFKIPFKNLPFPNGTNQEWKFLFKRRTYRNGNEVELSSQKFDRNNSCEICQTSDILILKDIQIEKKFELLPYISGNISGVKPSKKSSLDYNKFQSNLGLGLNIDLNKNSLLEITLNPDFSQVEADVTQIDINSSYGLMYPEKRPFFNRGSDIVKFSDGAFYSRSINDPLISTKILSQGKKSRLYFLNALDQNTPYQIAGEDRSYFGEGGKSYVNVLRFQRLINASKRIGIITTNRFHKNGGYGNLIGTDGSFLFSKKWRLSYELFYNYNKEPNADWIETDDKIKNKTVKLDGDNLKGSAFYFELYRNTEHWKSLFSVKNISPNYQTDVGFMVKNNRRWATIYNSYQNFFNKKGLQFFSFGTKADLVYTFENNFKAASIDGIIELRTFFGSLIQYTYDLDIFKNYLGKNYRNLGKSELNITSSPSEFFTLTLNSTFGKDIAYNESIPDVGKEFTIFLSPSFQINNNLNLQPSIRYAKLKNIENNSYYFNGYISRFNFRYQFSNFLNIRIISEYNDFSDQFFIQPLIQWNPNPSTIFYVGGSQGSLEDFNSEFSSPFRIDRTQFFLKFQYLIGL
jgi:hypothetical protein